jgi:hypothetical protein
MTSIYVILEREHIGEVMRGERTTLPVSLPADKGAMLAIKTERDKPPTCMMEVVACDPDPEGFTLTIRPYVYPHTPRLLRSGSPLNGGGKARLMSARKRKFKNPKAKPPDGEHLTADQAAGYTDNPNLAVHDPGEAVDWEVQDWITLRAIGRDGKRRREQSLAARRERELLSIVERIELARQAARENYIDIGTDMLLLRRSMRERRSESAIARRLEDVERRAHRDAA